MLAIEEPTSKINRLESNLKRAQEKLLEIEQWQLDFDKKFQAETKPQEGTQHSPEVDSEVENHPETSQEKDSNTASTKETEVKSNGTWWNPWYGAQKHQNLESTTSHPPPTPNTQIVTALETKLLDLHKKTNRILG